jgi:hypothetical protein
MAAAAMTDALVFMAPIDQSTNEIGIEMSGVLGF